MNDFIACMIAAAICAACCIIGSIWGAERVQLEAVNSGAAEFYLDSNHAKQFRWKTNEVGK